MRKSNYLDHKETLVNNNVNKETLVNNKVNENDNTIYLEKTPKKSSE